MMRNLKNIGVPGNGWRRDNAGEIVYQVEPGTPAWHQWTSWLFEAGEQTVAVRAWNLNHRLYVDGPSPKIYGEAEIERLYQSRCEQEYAA